MSYPPTTPTTHPSENTGDPSRTRTPNLPIRSHRTDQRRQRWVSRVALKILQDRTVVEQILAIVKASRKGAR